MNCFMFPLALRTNRRSNCAALGPRHRADWQTGWPLRCSVLLNGFFVGAEFALVKIRTSHLKTMAASGSKRAGLLRTIKDNLECVPVCMSGRHNDGKPRARLVGRTLPSSNASAVFHLGRNRIPPRHQIGFVCAGIFGDHVFAHRGGRTGTKILAIRKAMPAALFVSAPLRRFYIIFKPAIWFLIRREQLGLSGGFFASSQLPKESWPTARRNCA